MDRNETVHGIIKEYIGNPFEGDINLNLYTGLGQRFDEGIYNVKKLTFDNTRNVNNKKISNKNKFNKVAASGDDPIYGGGGGGGIPGGGDGGGSDPYEPSVPVRPGNPKDNGGSNSGGGNYTVNLPQSGPKIDPKIENKCFILTQSAQMTIYVQQPNEKTRDFNGTNGVGHVFVGIKQGNTERVYGYYPDGNASDVSIAFGKSYEAELRDNSKTLYHVSISKNVTASELTKIVNYANNFPKTYNLENYACVHFGIEMAKLGGINLPRTSGAYYIFKGLSPGNLGEDIRKGNFPNTTKKTTAGNAPSKIGTCK